MEVISRSVQKVLFLPICEVFLYTLIRSLSTGIKYKHGHDSGTYIKIVLFPKMPRPITSLLPLKGASTYVNDLSFFGLPAFHSCTTEEK